MRKIAVWSVDYSPIYQAACLVSIYSFLKYHQGWELMFYNVGAKTNFINALPPGTTVVPAQRNDWIEGMNIPTSKARCRLVAELPATDTVVVYTDCDAVYLGSLEPALERIQKFDRPLAIYQEDHKRLSEGIYVAGGWKNWIIPSLYKNSQKWHNKNVLNTGLLLCNGPMMSEVGKHAVSVFDEAYPTATWGEQSLLGSAIYDMGLDFMSFTDNEHCMLEEDKVVHIHRPYIDPCMLNGKPIILRHFCGYGNKQILFAQLDTLMEYYVGSRIDCSV